jgi:hypothetical protein
MIRDIELARRCADLAQTKGNDALMLIQAAKRLALVEFEDGDREELMHIHAVLEQAARLMTDASEAAWQVNLNLYDEPEVAA